MNKQSSTSYDSPYTACRYQHYPMPVKQHSLTKNYYSSTHFRHEDGFEKITGMWEAQPEIYFTTLPSTAIDASTPVPQPTMMRPLHKHAYLLYAFSPP